MNDKHFSEQQATRYFFLKRKLKIASFTAGIKQNIYVMDEGQVQIKTGATTKKNHTFTSIHASPQVIPRIHVIL